MKLITKSIRTVEQGNILTEETYNTMQDVVKLTDNVNEHISEMDKNVIQVNKKLETFIVV